jgi:hypothetical protein
MPLFQSLNRQSSRQKVVGCLIDKNLRVIASRGGMKNWKTATRSDLYTYILGNWIRLELDLENAWITIFNDARATDEDLRVFTVDSESKDRD